MPEPIKILAAANDPGGAQALLSVLTALNANPAYRLHIIAGPLAARLLPVRGLSFEPSGKDMVRSEAAALFNRHKPDILLTGTSWQSDMEQQLRNQAFLTAISSVVVIDFWSNYTMRWDGAVYPINNLADTVCVPDELAAAEMVEAGFPGDKITATGQPFLEEMFSQGSAQANKAETDNILFLSQPSAVDGKTISQTGHIRRVVEVLTEIAKKKNRRCVLKIKLHPKEAKDAQWQTLALTLSNKFCGVKIADQHKNIAVFLAWAGQIIGYNTMAQFQARAMGRQTISIAAYGISNSLRQAMREAGTISIPTDMTGLPKALTDNAAAPCRNFHQGAAANIMATIDLLRI